MFKFKPFDLYTITIKNCVNKLILTINIHDAQSCRYPIPFTNMAWNYDNLMHGLICPVTISLGQVQPFGPRGGELFEAVLSQAVGDGANKKYFLFDFAKYVLFLAQYARWLRTLRLRIFEGKCRNLLESG